MMLEDCDSLSHFVLGLDESVVIPVNHTPGDKIIWELQYETCTDEYVPCATLGAILGTCYIRV